VNLRKPKAPSPNLVHCPAASRCIQGTPTYQIKGADAVLLAIGGGKRWSCSPRGVQESSSQSSPCRSDVHIRGAPSTLFPFRRVNPAQQLSSPTSNPHDILSRHLSSRGSCIQEVVRFRLGNPINSIVSVHPRYLRPAKSYNFSTD